MNLAHRSRASWLMRIAVMVPMVAISSGCSSDASVGAQGGESVATDGFSQEGGDLGMDLSDLGPPGDAAGDTTGATVDVNRTLPDGEGPDDCDGCFGAPCEGDDDCLSGYCLPTLEGNACSKACEEECPAGFACLPLETGADTTFLCMDEHLTYCYPCAGDSDCGHPLASGLNGRCVVGESWEGSFCASPCHSDDECPSESVCQAVEVDGESSNLCVPIEGACPCYPRAVEDAATTPCSSVNDHGSCDGARMCTDQGLTACDASTPIAELCNDVDDDCDAGVDEAFPDKGQPCDGEDEDLCSDGLWLCTEDGDVACSDSLEAALEICNESDDDCDGDVDEGFEGKGQTCDGNDLDLCADGVLVCQAGGLVCDDDAADSPEICDGLDNDCDGETDEGLTAELTEVQAGVCAGSLMVCAGADGWVEPVWGELDGHETIESLCDGLDNDCDGDTDEELIAPLAELVSGVCAGSVKWCDGPSGWQEPSYEAIGDYEVDEVSCDGKDNNCDGLVDEPFSAGGIVSISDTDGTTGLVLGDACGLGPCAGGEVLCNEAGDGLHCSTAALSTKEACDFADNDCDGAADEDFDLSSDLLNCGTCGVVCLNDHGASTCSLGQCSPTCEALWGDCDGQPNNGCETGLTGLNNCGNCGEACKLVNGGETCASGTCVLTNCDADYANCDGVDLNGCEAHTLSSESHCGSCGIACTNPHGDTSCVGGTCVPTCDAGWSDCDGDPTNGCETDTTTVLNCGACGKVCELANASPGCNVNTCVIAVCDLSYDDCDGAAANGCETHLAVDTNHCGACGFSCANPHGSTFCVGGKCAPSCASNWGDCDGSPANGCETALTTLNNCSACGSPCSLANASETCSSGLCAIDECTDGYCDLDGSAATGCELDLDTNPGCATTYTNLGSVDGDTGSTSIVETGRGEAWFRVKVKETDDWIDSLTARVTLTVPAGADYDLSVHWDSCTGAATTSLNSGSANEEVNLSWSDDWGNDDTRFFFIQVERFSAKSCANWTLVVEGDT